MVFDVNAESVGVAIVLSKDNAVPCIVYMGREYFRDGKDKSARETIDAMHKAFGRVEGFLAKNVLSHPVFRSYAHGATHYVFSEPWLESKIKTVTIEYPSPVKVTERLLSIIKEQEARAFREELSARFGVARDAFTVIENKITSVRLDEKTTDVFIGVEAKKVEVSLYIGAIPTEVRNAVAFPAEDKKGAQKVFCASFPFAIAESIKQNFGEKDFVVLDIVGPMTQAFVVRDGILSAQMTIPVGDDMLVSAVEKNLSVSKHEAISRLRLFFRDHADRDHSLAMQKIVAEAGTLWRKEFETTMSLLGDVMAVPSLFFVLVRMDEAPFFVRNLRHENMLEIGAGKKSVAPTFLTEGLFKSKAIIDHDASDDLTLSLLSAHFASKSHYKNK